MSTDDRLLGGPAVAGGCDDLGPSVAETVLQVVGVLLIGVGLWLLFGLGFGLIWLGLVALALGVVGCR
jgi:hypothetical protein